MRPTGTATSEEHRGVVVASSRHRRVVLAAARRRGAIRRFVDPQICASTAPWIHRSVDPLTLGFTAPRTSRRRRGVIAPSSRHSCASLDPARRCGAMHRFVDPQICGSTDPCIHRSVDPQIRGSTDPWTLDMRIHRHALAPYRVRKVGRG